MFQTLQVVFVSFWQLRHEFSKFGYLKKKMMLIILSFNKMATGRLNSEVLII